MSVPLPRKIWRVFKRYGVVGWSKKKNIFGINPLVLSTIFIFLTLCIASLARKITKVTVKDILIKSLILEFIATLELCTACFELIIVADNWGIEAYALYLFLLSIWWSFSWEDSTACPYNPIEDLLQGMKQYYNVGLIILTQILAGLVTFKNVQLVWAMELVETHRGKAFEKCSADLQVDYLTGAMIELVATCICRIISRSLAETNSRAAGIVATFFEVFMVVAAFNLTGGYFNPVLATSLKLGCKGNTFMEHFVVYWLGSTLGSVISVYIYKTRVFQEFIYKIKID